MTNFKDNVNDVVDKAERIAETAVLSIVYFTSGVFNMIRTCSRRYSTAGGSLLWASMR